ncbi:MAG: dephospho-CoA kinase [Nitrospirota bacterium]|nr:dephospho-CoA kinase [Nitrospirota bacterium]
MTATAQVHTLLKDSHFIGVLIQGSSAESQGVRYGAQGKRYVVACQDPMLSCLMIVAGLTGGLATGKSTIAQLFKHCGAVVLDADILARAVVRPGKPAWRDIVRTYGKGVLRADRSLDRTALARIVFQSRAKLRALNAIVHPWVARQQARLTKQAARKDPRAVVIYDAPLLIEAGAHRRMDRIIVINADRETQITRLRERNQLTRPEALRRIRSQMPLAQKVKLADYVIDGTLPVAQLRGEVTRIFSELQRLA